MWLLKILWPITADVFGAFSKTVKNARQSQQNVDRSIILKRFNLPHTSLVLSIKVANDEILEIAKFLTKI